MRFKVGQKVRLKTGTAILGDANTATGGRAGRHVYGIVRRFSPRAGIPFPLKIDVLGWKNPDDGEGWFFSMNEVTEVRKHGR